jgi:hypothetical protein
MELDSLSSLLLSFNYPDPLEHIDCGILGDGFYPGAQGFSAGKSPEGGILLLGRDFGTKQYYERLCGTPARDETTLTWRHTRDVYLKCFQGLPVWCTNYLVGIRKNGSAKGNIKARIRPSDWQAFEEHCWGFLQAQVLLQRPRLVVVLGGYNRDDLSVQNRLGFASEGMHYSFASKGVMHEVLIAFADHPHSLIPKARQDAARIRAEQLRAIFEHELLDFRLK